VVDYHDNLAIGTPNSGFTNVLVYRMVGEISKTWLAQVPFGFYPVLNQKILV
jgi:hypothetical protein